MTVYGAATGNYSRDSILEARKHNNASAGDQILNGKFIDNTGGTNNYSTSDKGFNTNSMFNDALSAKNALLEQMYKNTVNSLTNNYNTEKVQLEGQRNDINANYDQIVKDVHGQTYQNVEANKILSANRGMMNSEQGLASRQNVIRAGNTNVNNATDARNQALNGLASQIANLTQNYNSNLTNAQNQFDLGKVEALNDINAQKGQMNYDLWKYNTTYDRQVETENRQNAFTEKMANLQQSFAIDLNNLDYDHQYKLAQLGGDIQARLASMSNGASNARMKMEIDMAYNEAQANTFMAHFSPYVTQYGAKTAKMYDQAILNLQKGVWDYDTAYNNLVTTYKAEGKRGVK